MRKETVGLKLFDNAAEESFAVVGDDVNVLPIVTHATVEDGPKSRLSAFRPGDADVRRRSFRTQDQIPRFSSVSGIGFQ